MFQSYFHQTTDFWEEFDVFDELLEDLLPIDESNTYQSNIIITKEEPSSESSVEGSIHENQSRSNQPSHPSSRSNKKPVPVTTNHPKIVAKSHKKYGKYLIKEESIEIARHQLPKKEFIQKLFPSDLRACFGRMLADAFNTSNEGHLMNMLSNLCTTDCQAMEYFNGLTMNPFGKCNRTVTSPLAILHYWALFSIAIPDGVFDLTDERMRTIPYIPDSFSPMVTAVRNAINTKEAKDITLDKLLDQFCSNPYIQHHHLEDDEEDRRGTMLHATYEFYGTKLFDLVDTMTTDTNCTVKHSTSGMGTLVSLLPRKDIVQKARPDFHIKGTLIILLGKENKIKRFEFHYSNKSEIDAL